MILAYLLLLTGLTLSAVAIYYSVVGLTAIFSAAVIPIIVMGASLEIAKLVCASWLKANWDRVPRFMKLYMSIAVVVLMLITSMGIFGFLSKAHNDQNLVSGDVQSKIAIYDEKIATARSNIDANRKQLTQMDAAVDQVMGRSSDEKGADKANAIRNSQKRDRAALAKDIESQQKIISQLNDEAAPIRAEVRKVEAEVGPVKYIAKFIYGDHGADENMLEKAVTWIILLIVVVFDPLAVIMLLASQMTFAWARGEIPKEDKKSHRDIAEWFIHAKERARFWDKQSEPDSHIVDNTQTEDPVTVDTTDLTVDQIHTFETIPETDTDNPIDFPDAETELDRWNKMIEEAERQLAEENSTVEERVAKGETYIDGTGHEVALQADLSESNDSKKKTYMIKDNLGQIQLKIRN